MTSIGGYSAWASLSDGRYKLNVKDDAPGLDFINQLRPVTYQVDYESLSRKEYAGEVQLPENVLKRSKERSEERQTGFIAQEVEKLVEKMDVTFDGVRVPENEKVSMHSAIPPSWFPL